MQHKVHCCEPPRNTNVSFQHRPGDSPRRGPAPCNREYITVARGSFAALCEGLGGKGQKKLNTPQRAMGVVSGMAICSKNLPFWKQKCLLPSISRGVVPNLLACLVPHNVIGVGYYQSSLRGTMDCCLGGLTKGIIGNDSHDLKGGMDVRKGGGVDVFEDYFLRHFLMPTSLNHI